MKSISQSGNQSFEFVVAFFSLFFTVLVSIFAKGFFGAPFDTFAGFAFTSLVFALAAGLFRFFQKRGLVFFKSPFQSAFAFLGFTFLFLFALALFFFFIFGSPAFEGAFQIFKTFFLTFLLVFAGTLTITKVFGRAIDFRSESQSE